ncbi:type II toxin-antitoxin system RelE/ParE family toxin [Vibrio vulnificus]|nr:type II toxin-antitoxin system RelE/ParE family toxin [Vibrio vulnificus]
MGNCQIRSELVQIYPSGFYFPVGKHTAYFTKEDGFILVVAILGQSQLPQNHL